MIRNNESILTTQAIISSTLSRQNSYITTDLKFNKYNPTRPSLKLSSCFQSIRATGPVNYTKKPKKFGNRLSREKLIKLAENVQSTKCLYKTTTRISSTSLQSPNNVKNSHHDSFDNQNHQTSVLFQERSFKSIDEDFKLPEKSNLDLSISNKLKPVAFFKPS